MARYSYDTSPAEDAALTTLTGVHNAFAKTSLTVAQYAALKLSALFTDMAALTMKSESEKVRAAYEKATDADRTAVKTRLGL